MRREQDVRGGGGGGQAGRQAGRGWEIDSEQRKEKAVSNFLHNA